MERGTILAGHTHLGRVFMFTIICMALNARLHDAMELWRSSLA